jgi:hypothetical protein
LKRNDPNGEIPAEKARMEELDKSSKEKKTKKRRREK